MALSTNTYTYAGGAQTFAVNFALGFIQRSDVTVRVNGAVDGAGDPAYASIEWIDDSSITVLDTLTVGDSVEVLRTVSKAELKVNFTAGADITPDNLDLSAKQGLMVYQELADGRVEGSEAPSDAANRAQSSSAAALVSETAAAASAAAAANSAATVEFLGIDDNATSTAITIDSSENVGIGTTSPDGGRKLDVAGNVVFGDGGGFDMNVDGTRWQFSLAGTERMRMDSSGNLLVGKTSASLEAEGIAVKSDGSLFVTRSSATPVSFRRSTTDGSLVDFYKDGSTVGSVVTKDGDIAVGTSGVGLRFGQNNSDQITPHSMATNTGKDNALSLGSSGARFDDIYATNGTIQTSDRNEKQQIASLTGAEMVAAKAISAGFKTFKWNDSVEEKGDAARVHPGVIAQEVEQAMTGAGLDAGDYAFFISNTWWETQTDVPAVEAVDAVYEDVAIPAVLDDEGNEVEPETTEQRLVSEAVEAKEAYTRTDTYDTAEEAPEGATERTRKGIRYPQLLSFVGAATEQRLADIETRLTLLEAAN